MSSARRKGASTVEVYQDPEDSIADSELARTLQNYTNSLDAVGQDITNTAIVLGPPASQTSISPRKRSSPRSSPLRDVDQSIFDSVSFPPPANYFPTDSPTKKNFYAPCYAHATQKPQKGLFTTFSSTSGPSRDARRLSVSGIPPFTSSDPLYSHMPNFGKRSATDAIFMERPMKRARHLEDLAAPLPAPEEMPAVPDEDGKPSYSYAQLIGMAILRAPDRKTTLSQIYKWISDTFSFYRTGQAGAGWQNSIRHNLSLNKSFVKKERPKEDPGKGNYWAIQEGSEAQFFKDKTHHRPATADQAYFDTPRNDTCPLPMPATAMTSQDGVKPSVNADSSGFPAESVSSDATLPMSDQDEVQPHEFAPAPRRPQSPGLALPSSPPPDLNSSPPIPRHAPPPENIVHPQRSSMSRSGGRQKRTDNFKDSGFYSSIESSIPRGKFAPHFSSEANGRSSGLKRGRAEEEIFRMRASSFDSSPTKAHHTFKKPRLDPNMNSSSPLRGAGASIGFPPLTPGLKLRPPTKAPPTVSPNTQLRLHRESIRDLVGTPGQKELAAAEEIKFTPSFIFADEDAWSPRFSPNRNLIRPTPLKQQTNLDDIEDPFIVEDRDYSHSIESQQSDEETYGATDLTDLFANGSPIAKKMQRPAGHRASTSTSALQDITKSNRNVRLGSPIRLSPPKKGGRRTSSPAKKVIEPKNDVFLGAVDSSEEEPIQGSLDITKGFRPISQAAGKENEHTLGATIAPTKGLMTVKSSRPPLGRSSTNLV
ncbi:MAG: hypothetical protein Q9159_005590 [Coniocarpon cinnabarinum]